MAQRHIGLGAAPGPQPRPRAHGRNPPALEGLSTACALAAAAQCVARPGTLETPLAPLKAIDPRASKNTTRPIGLLLILHSDTITGKASASQTALPFFF